MIDIFIDINESCKSEIIFNVVLQQFFGWEKNSKIVNSIHNHISPVESKYGPFQIRNPEVYIIAHLDHLPPSPTIEINFAQQT